MPIFSDNRRILLGLQPNTPLVFRRILDKKMVTIGLSRISRIRLIKQVLDSNKNLLDGNSRSPTAVFIKN